MAIVSAFSSLISISNSKPRRIPSHSLSPSSPLIRNLHFQLHGVATNSFTKNLTLRNNKGNPKNPFFHGRIRRVRSVEEETQIPEGGEEPVAEVQEEADEQQTVSVPVSPSDTLTMFFQAEGTMSESAIPAVSKALEGIEGVSDLKIQTIEGIASVELTKQTTVQATGVASSLVEIIQGSGFKLQTLNLSFEDEEDFAVV